MPAKKKNEEEVQTEVPEVEEVEPEVTNTVGGAPVDEIPEEEDDNEEEDEDDADEDDAESESIIAASDERLSELSPMAKVVLEHLKGQYREYTAKVSLYENAVQQRVTLPVWKEQLASNKDATVTFDVEQVSIGGKSLRKLLAELSKDNPTGLVNLLAFLDQLHTLVNEELGILHLNAFRLPEGVPTRDELVALSAKFVGEFAATKGFVGIHFDWAQFVGYTGIPVKLKGVKGSQRTEAYAGPKFNAKKSKNAAGGSQSFHIRGNSTKVRLVVDGKIIDDMSIADAIKVYLDLSPKLLTKWLADNNISDFGALWRIGAVRMADDSKRVHAVSFVPTGTKEIPEAHTALLTELQNEQSQAEVEKAERTITSSGKRDEVAE